MGQLELPWTNDRKVKWDNYLGELLSVCCNINYFYTGLARPFLSTRPKEVRMFDYED